MNPYESIAQTPEVLFYYAAIILALLAATGILGAWLFFSYRKMFNWANNIQAASDRWKFFLVPPEDLTGDIFWFIIVGAINTILFAGSVFVLGLFVHYTI